MTLDLGRPAIARELCVRFQGGFAGKECLVMGGATEEDLKEIAQFYPTDSNSLQVSSSIYSHVSVLGSMWKISQKKLSSFIPSMRSVGKGLILCLNSATAYTLGGHVRQHIEHHCE